MSAVATAAVELALLLEGNPPALALLPGLAPIIFGSLECNIP